MTPVIHCSGGNIHFFPRTAFFQRREIPIIERNVSGNYTQLPSPSQRFLLRQSSLCLFQSYRSGFLSRYGPKSQSQSIAAVGADVTVEESNPAVSDEDTNDSTEAAKDSVETGESPPRNPVVTSNAKTRRSRSLRSEMPQVKDEDLTPGASFIGKVRSIQPFGAFVDFGAFTDGLVHVSRMSDGYVQDVGSLVSLGQEVKVRIVEANMETGRISLTMRENDDARKIPQRRENLAGESGDRPRPARKNAARSTQKRVEEQKNTKFVKGQVLTGTVKNTIRSGSFVSLPEGEEGFIPVSEESEGYGNVSGNSSLHVGQEVNVRVLRIARGKVTLTMKKEEDIEELNRQLNKGVWHAASNPFELAFRNNKDIANFLDEQERTRKSSEKISLPDNSAEIEGQVGGTITKPDAVLVDGLVSSEEVLEETPSAESVELANDDENVPQSLSENSDSSESLSGSLSDSNVAEVPVQTDPKDSSASVDTIKENIGRSEASISENSEYAVSLVKDVDPITNEGKEADIDTESAEANKEDSSSEAPIVDTIKENKEDSSSEAPIASVDSIKENIGRSEASFSENSESAASLLTDVDPITNEGKEADTDTEPAEANKEDSSSEAPIVDEVPVTEEVEETVAENKVVSEHGECSNILSSQESEDSADAATIEASEEIGDTSIHESSNGQTSNPDAASAIKAISPALVKQLREETGAGMMDCKKALTETGGDIVKAQEFLRQKGLASADKKSSRATAEGRVGSYIHDGRIGVLIELNCETDFVSRGEIFRQLVDDLAMQVAACPQVRYLVAEDVPEEIVNKEREIEMQREDLLSKPEHIRSQIVDGRIRKRLAEFALLEQPFIKNDQVMVKDWVKQTIATIGENIKVKRFARYNLGEGLEKKSQDFAAEVAAQTAAKESPPTTKDQHVETGGTVEKPVAIAVSAALVKQLREETGAGMMDCKKALTESGGDLEKAQEYLRKKGLSSADKKSSRLAAEGRISSYIHDARMGCLVEVNSETDFVARNEKFKELVDDLAMQVVACPQVEFVSVEDIPKEVVDKEKEIEMGKDDLKSKPENIREKIVEGRISKRLGELALLEQPFIKDDKVMVKDLVKQTVAALGENIKVRRFVRFALGENED